MNDYYKFLSDKATHLLLIVVSDESSTRTSVFVMPMAMSGRFAVARASKLDFDIQTADVDGEEGRTGPSPLIVAEAGCKMEDIIRRTMAIGLTVTLDSRPKVMELLCLWGFSRVNIRILLVLDGS